MKFTRVDHQFTLFDYNQLRPRCKIPIRRISRKQMEQAVIEMKSGRPQKLQDILSDVSAALEKYDKRLTNKSHGLQKR